jgi:uncharacterized damage-inducible protein DinB
VFSMWHEQGGDAVRGEGTSALAGLLIAELTQEVATTRRVLERVPEDQLSWVPHPTSMSLGQLAMHVAVIPGAQAGPCTAGARGAPAGPVPEATSRREILSALDRSAAIAEAKLSAWAEAELLGGRCTTEGRSTVPSLRCIDKTRNLILEHWQRHRSRLVVYLRLLNVVVPAVYGASIEPVRVNSKSKLS